MNRDAIKNFALILLSVIRRVIPPLYYIIIIGTVFGVSAAFLSLNYLNGNGPLKQEVSIVIPSGASTMKIAKQLSENKVIEYPGLFALFARISPYSNTLKAGEYSFSEGATPYEVMQKIHSGKVVVRNITIAEGLLTFQVVEIIKDNPVLTGDVPEGIKDGDLLPQTYDYHYGESRAAIIKRMQEAMHKTLDELWNERQEGLPFENKEQALILASIVEKETGIPGERSRVAAVFINRLKIGMRLQTDPSVMYAVTKGESLLGRPLTYKDLEIDSPYNTYKNIGLPPGPIANPGRASIEAVLHPMDTKEIYFVADGTGGHIFSTTLKQHNINVNKWRKIERQMQKKQVQ